ncbi:FAD-binding oxidoreductase [Litorivita sp. NS0012-18]|uniref:FAD-binding oxidoreductase n=1 Tax=Litorivita sp. NS0012-18 TaxID=3127655 RepID=UPI003109B343
MIDELRAIVGAKNLLTGGDMAGYARDWSGKYSFTPRAVARPRTAQEIGAILRLANQTGTPVVPMAGNTGLAGGTYGEGAIIVSLERMTAIREIRQNARIAIVEAGVILSDLHEACAAQDMIFPLTFGARGSARIGGCLATNAGGSNVLRYGNTRDLCLGLEVVLPTGEVMEIMSELHKDNSGYNLKHLMIGAEGTLGIITAAVLKLHPKPRAYATAMVAAPDLPSALALLNRLQEETGGAVEAFEYMPRNYIEGHIARGKSMGTPAPEPFDAPYEVNILVEVAATAPRDADAGPDGQTPLAARLEEVLGALLDSGEVLDAVIAQNEAQRAQMWERREAAAEIAMARQPIQLNDIAVPLDRVADFLEAADAAVARLDGDARSITVAHLGDGNVHYSVWPSHDAPDHIDAIMEAVEEVALSMGGSFSAEHGIGITKKPSMARRKNAASIGAMRAIKAALDPNGILNPGKVLPDA